MHLYYCKKCKSDSLNPVCDHCGMQITSLNQNERFKWRSLRVPLGDTAAVLRAIRLLGLTQLMLLALIAVGELVVSPDKQAAAALLTGSGVLTWSIVFFLVGVALILLVMGLQGKEELHFTVDSHGVHLQTWIAPSHLACFARFINYNSYAIATLPDGSKRMMISEAHLLWGDVCRFEVRRQAGRIDFFRPSSFLLMSIYPDNEEMDLLLEYILPRMKHLTKR